MTEKEVIMEVIGFFIVPYKPKKDEPQYYEPIEDEQEHFQKILNFQLVSEREDERQYELKNKIERLEVLKNNMIEFEKPSFNHIAKIDRFIKFCKDNTVHSDAKYTAKETALAYILDTYSKGQQLPINRIDGGFDQKQIYLIGESKGWKGNTFMKAIREVKKYDLNKVSDLQTISKDWYNAVLELSENKEQLKAFLQPKGKSLKIPANPH